MTIKELNTWLNFEIYRKQMVLRNRPLVPLSFKAKLLFLFNNTYPKLGNIVFNSILEYEIKILQQVKKILV